MVFHIALKDLKVVFRDRKALAVLLLMPSLIILILGTALGSMFSNELAIDKFSIGVVSKDDGLMSGVFINRYLRENMSELFETYVVDENKAEEMLEEKVVPSIIIIPEDFSDNINNNRPVKLEVKSQVEGQFKSGIVESVTESFAKGISLSHAGADAVVDELNKLNISIPVSMKGMSKGAAIMGELQKELSSTIIQFGEVDQERHKTLNAIQFYSASMLVMFILFGVNTGTRLMAEERESKTMGRIMSARANRATLITGKFLGLAFICILQALILIFFTRFIYGVDWGSSIPGIMLITLCAVFAGSGFGMFIASATKTSKAADGLGMILIQVFTLVGGGMIPYYVLPERIKQIAQVTLNWWAVKGYHELMLGVDLQKILPYCGILLIMGVVYLSVGMWRFKVE